MNYSKEYTDRQVRLKAGRVFLRLIHRNLKQKDGRVAFLIRNPGGRFGPTLYAMPGQMPTGLNLEDQEVFFSVCTFRGKRKAENAISIPACWADLDPPHQVDLEAWRLDTEQRIERFAPQPSLIVSSGRGFHLYWCLKPPIRLAAIRGESRRIAVNRLETLNRKLAATLDGDSVSDLARVLRLPGTLNAKNNSSCRLIFGEGPFYRFEDLESHLQHVEVERVTRLDVHELSQPGKKTRRPGRPRLGATKRDLRTLPRWARDLVMGGAWRAGKRYFVHGFVDRSRADLAVVGAMVKAGWSDEKILSAFSRPDWLIADRFHELWEQEGWKRASQYLARTIARAKL